MFIEAGIDLDNTNEEGDTAMMMTGARSLQSHNVMKLFLDVGAKSCVVNIHDCSLVESLLFSSHGVIINDRYFLMLKNAFIIFNSYCFNFSLV